MFFKLRSSQRKKMAEDAVVQHGAKTARACLMSQSCERYDRKRSNGTADWLGIKVDVSVPSACRLVPNSRKDVFNGIRRA